MSADTYSYLGKSMQYPTVLVKGAAKIATGIQAIESSLIMILTTPKGSRYFLPDFGSRVAELLNEPNDEVLKKLLSVYIMDAIQQWEKRIKIVNVQILMGVDAAICTIYYRVLNSNEIESFIFPFFKRELPF